MMEDLAAEARRIEEAARDSNSRYQFLDRIDYPEGVRLAVNFTLDFDAMLLRRLLGEPVPQRAHGEFGGRVGIWRMIELFDRYGIKGTIFTPGRICELYPDSLQAIRASGHEIADHMWEHRVPPEEELARNHLQLATEALTAAAGTPPVGSRSWNPNKLLKELGYIYNSHGSAHHLPHYYDDGSGETLLNLPFHFAIDDAMYFSFAWLGSSNAAQRVTEPGRVMEMWWDAFEQQYEAGGYLNICMHPFVSGRALRVAALARLIERMQAKPGVWFPTCREVAELVLERHPMAEG